MCPVAPHAVARDDAPSLHASRDLRDWDNSVRLGHSNVQPTGVETTVSYEDGSGVPVVDELTSTMSV
jgi:hypothetical protein